MKLKQAYFLGSVLVQMFVITSLITASPILTTSVSEGGTLPWGNVMTWVLFILFPLNFLILRKKRRVHPIPQGLYALSILISLVMGLCWLPISFWLSGNWSATFSGDDGNRKLWEVYTYLTPSLPFVGYFGMRLLSVFFKVKPSV